VNLHSESAGELVRRAAQIEVVVPPGAQARVWRSVEKKRARAAWRLALPMFALGAATAALVLFSMQPAKPTASREAPKMVGPLPLAGEPSLVQLGSAARLVTGANTVARVDRFDAGGVELSLKTGSVLLHVQPRRPGEAFIVRAPDFEARVVGTVFRVAAGPRGSSLVVGHGTVELIRPGSGPQLIHSGERWPANAADAPSAAELELMGTGELEGARFDAEPSEPQLYAAGLQKLRARDLHGALALWHKQRARFPGGVLARDAQASIIDALVALHEDAQARAEVDAYLREAPDGLRAAEMHFVRGTLLYAADHDCRRAAAELERALQRPAEPWATRARAALAACRAH
jgi:hypothetical protein